MRHKNSLLLLRTLATVAVAEIVVMVLLRGVHLSGALAKPMLDAFALAFVSAPFLYLLVVRPVLRELIRKADLERELAHRELALANAAHREAETTARLMQHWQRTFDAMKDAIWILDDGHRVTQSNAAAEGIFGRPNSEILGRPCWETAHGTTQPIPDCPVSRARVSLARETSEFQVGEKWLEVTVDPLLDSDGRFEGAIHAVRDVTARKKAERALLESQNKFQSIFESAQDGILISRLSTNHFAEANAAICQMLGYTRAELLALGMEDIHPAADLPRVLLEFNRQLRGERRVAENLPVRRKDGSLFYADISANPIELEGESYQVGVFRDITARKEAGEALRESKRVLEAVLKALPVGVWLLDAQGNIIQGNPAGELIWAGARYVGPERYGEYKGWWLSTGKPIAPEEWAAARAMRQGEMVLDEELEIECFDGTHKIILNSAIPLRTEQGGIAGVIVVNIDISDRKRAEEEKRTMEAQVQQTQKLESLGVLAGGIAHDFNNILMAVLGHAELALTDTPPLSAAHRNLTGISTAARRAAELCRQMLAYAGKSSFALQGVGLRELVEEMAHLLKTAISKKAILNLRLEDGLPPIQADPSQIRQIVMNLIINASEAIGDRSGVITVTVGATRCDEEYLRKTEFQEELAPGLYVHLEVTDTGAGMDPQTRARIFEPFFTTKFTGRGLGLAAVLGIVRAHKGALKVYSEPGKGTTFKILFPALADADHRALRDEAAPSSEWRGTGTILLVDDEESLLALGAQMLEHLGFTVLTAVDGREAVDLYRARGKEIDLVLMDLTMPHMDGAEALGELRRLNPDLKVVLASGYAHEELLSRFAGKRLDGALQKPFTLRLLREALVGLMPERPGGLPGAQPDSN